MHRSLAADIHCPAGWEEVDVHIPAEGVGHNLAEGVGHNLAEEADHSSVGEVDHMPAEVAEVHRNLVALVGRNPAVAVDHSLAEVTARSHPVGHNHLAVQVRHTDQLEAHRNLVVLVSVRPVYHMNCLWHREAI